MLFVIYHQWEKLPEEANVLFAECEQQSLFYSRVWLETLSEYALAKSQTLLLACVVENNNFKAILPMKQCAQNGLSALSTNFTSQFSLLVANSHSQVAIISCLVDGLVQMSVNSLQLDPIDSADSNMSGLCKVMCARGYQGYDYFKFYNWSHFLNGQSFDEYMAARPATVRNTIDRKRRKLEREHDYDIRLYQDRFLDQAINDYQEVYIKSWKANEVYSDFTPNLVKNLSRQGWLRMAILYINSQPAAAQIWFVVHAKAYIYRLVFDEKWRTYSPGSILTHYLLHHVIEKDKVLLIDFLVGNERYKQDWMTSRRELIGIRFALQKIHKSRLAKIIHSIK